MAATSKFAVASSMERENSADSGRFGSPTVVIDTASSNAVSTTPILDLPAIAPYPFIPGYEILGAIGKGGMGIVYKARHLDLNRIVALKVLAQGSMAILESQERFQREAEAVARLQHPNIIQIFDFGSFQQHGNESRSNPYLSLEYVEGGNLARQTVTPQSPKYSAELVEKLARAAHAAHRLGVIHRDLKPANVLLTPDGEPKISDFGLAKHLDPVRDDRGRFHTEAGFVVGTPEYMAPEQVAGAEPTAAIDIYALGVILYELLTARVPFIAANPVETMFLVKYEDPVSPRRLQPKLPRDLETICLKCLAKLPHQRYRTAEDLADDLNRFREGRTILARPVGVATRMAKWAKRYPIEAGLTAASILIAVIGISGVVWKWQEARANAQRAIAAVEMADELNRAERWERYRANIVAASSAMQANNVWSARRALESAPEEYRNWEWRHLDRQLDSSDQVFFGGAESLDHSTRPTASGRVLIHDKNSTTYIWDSLTRRTVRTFPQGSNVEPLQLCPDGHRYLCHGPDHALQIRDVNSDRVLVTLNGNGRKSRQVELAARADIVAVADDDGTIHICDTTDGRARGVYRGHHRPTIGFNISPDGRRVASSSGADGIHLWDAESGIRYATVQSSNDRQAGGHFNLKGDRLLIVKGFPINDLWLIDATNGRRLAVMSGHANQIVAHAFSNDGLRIATSSMDQTIRLWDGRSGKLLSVLKGHAGWVNSVAFSRDDQWLVSGANDRTVRLWDVASATELAVLRGHTNVVFDASFTHDGSQIVSCAYDGTLRIWDAAAAARKGALRGHTNYVYSVAMHPDGDRAASASWDGTVRVWELATGRTIRTLDHGARTPVTSVAFHPGGKLLASICRDQRVRLWDATDGKLLQSWPVPLHGWQDTRLAFSPNGNLLACGAEDRTVRLFDVDARREIAALEGHADTVRDVAFSPDGKWLASGSSDGDPTVRIWNLATLQTKHVLKGHGNVVYGLAFRGDGRLLASSSWDGTVRLWDTSTWRETATLHHGTNVHCLAFTPDGSRLATGCADNTIRLWDVARAQDVAEFRGHEEYVHGLTFTPDGGKLISASGDTTLRIWDSLHAR